MKFLRFLMWPIVLLPALAAFVWTGFAARLPETIAQRQALGEATMKWSLAELPSFHHEPTQYVARALHLAALHVPGSSFWWSAAVNALLALLLVFALAGVARRAFGLGAGAQATALGLFGLLACSPAFGADWLHGARLGVFLVPLLLACGLWLLLGERRFAGRALLALLLAALAPQCHSNGVLVFVALAPSLLEAARRAGGGRGVGWIVALLLVGNLAAIASLHTAGGLALGDSGLLGRLLEAPAAALRELLHATGTAWLDPLPQTDHDELALGAASWLAPLLLWWIGDRSAPARRAAAPFWGCLWFGLLLFVLAAERHGADFGGAALRERTYGAFLLPVGCLGVLAARFGAGLVPFAAGMLAVLAVQDWYRGIEDLRLARHAADRRQMQAFLPTTQGGEPWTNPDEWRGLQALGWVPPGDGGFAADLQRLGSAEVAPTAGALLGGDARHVHGVVRSSLTRDTVTAVVVEAVLDERDRVADPRAGVLAVVVPDGAGHGRNVPWSARLPERLADGTRLAAFGYRLRSGTFVRLGPVFEVRDGTLQPIDGG